MLHPPLPVKVRGLAPSATPTEGGVWTGFLRVDKGHAAAEVSKLFLFQGAWLLGDGGTSRAG